MLNITAEKVLITSHNTFLTELNKRRDGHISCLIRGNHLPGLFFYIAGSTDWDEHAQQ